MVKLKLLLIDIIDLIEILIQEIKDFLKTIDNWELTPISCFKKKSMTRCTLVELLSDFMIDLKKLTIKIDNLILSNKVLLSTYSKKCVINQLNDCIELIDLYNETNLYIHSSYDSFYPNTDQVFVDNQDKFIYSIKLKYESLKIRVNSQQKHLLLIKIKLIKVKQLLTFPYCL